MRYSYVSSIQVPYSNVFHPHRNAAESYSLKLSSKSCYQIEASPFSLYFFTTAWAILFVSIQIHSGDLHVKSYGKNQLRRNNTLKISSPLIYKLHPIFHSPRSILMSFHTFSYKTICYNLYNIF